ncbi:MAG: hypothetical protein HYZ53_28895 [Planctomycetes bacterium]|nr:hypothetical protein [Planctomycetota bacterium]
MTTRKTGRHAPPPRSAAIRQGPDGHEPGSRRSDTARRGQDTSRRGPEAARKGSDTARLDLAAFPVVEADAPEPQVDVAAKGHARIEDRDLLLSDVRQYYRKWSRQEVLVPSEIVILVDGEKIFDRGVAQIKDISMKGARLSKMQLKKMVLPMKPFTIRLRFSGKRYKGIAALCKPVRFAGQREFELGVEFQNLWVEV